MVNEDVESKDIFDKVIYQGDENYADSTKGVLANFNTDEVYAVYAGSIGNMKEHGEGIWISNKSYYIGDFKDGQKQGKGTSKSETDGSLYEGDFRDDEPA